MEILKVLLVMAAGLGSTWMAREATEAVFGVARPQFLTQAEQPPQGSAGRQGGAGDGRSGGAVAAPEPGRQKMEADLRRAQERLGMGVTSEELREFRPTRPLPADLAVELPSDI
jgi:hypothetical protein